MTRDRIFLLALALGAILRLWDLGGYDLWADELHTALMAESSIAELLDPDYMAPYMPVYFLLAKGWRLLPGESEFVFRLLPAIAGILLIPILFRLLDAVVGRRAARYGALLAAVNPLMVYFSREHRMYSLYVTLAAAGALIALHDGRARRSIAIAVFIALFLTFPFALLFGGAFLVPIIFTDPINRREKLTSFLPGLLAGTIWVGWMLATADGSANAYYRQLGLSNSFSLLKSLIAGNFSMRHADLAPMAYLLTALGLLLGARAVVVLRRRPLLLLFWAAFAGLPIAAILVLQIRQGAIYNYKSFLPLVLPILFLLAVAIDSLPRRLALTVLLLFIGGNLWAGRALLDRSHRYNWSTSRQNDYSSRRITVEDSGLPLDGILILDLVQSLEAIHYGTPGEIPLFCDKDAVLATCPSYNRRAIEAILGRRAFFLPPPDGRRAASLLVMGELNANNPLPPGYMQANDNPIAGTTLLRLTSDCSRNENSN